MTAYEFSTEQPLNTSVAHTWPEDARLLRTAGRSTLLLFLHPKCPCSRATLAELERLAEDITSEEAPEFIVVATVPSTTDQAWLQTATVNRARNILNAQVFADAEGVEARKFGAVNSGLVMLFDPAGTCKYTGGITIARGQEGANVGRIALTNILSDAGPTASGIPAFGCRLCLPQPPAAKPATAAL
jgi:hypothetical protein